MTLPALERQRINLPPGGRWIQRQPERVALKTEEEFGSQPDLRYRQRLAET